MTTHQSSSAHSAHQTSTAAAAPEAIAESLWTMERDVDAGVVFLRHVYADDPQPSDWRSQMAASLARMPGCGVVGAKRLDQDGNVFSMGEVLVSPKGFHQIGRNQPGTCLRFPEEVDAIAGGVMAVRADLFDEADGMQLCQGELGGISLCLGIRRQGGRCVTIPSVVVTDTTVPDPSVAEESAFEIRFGFDWIAADLDAFADGDPLLWNPRYQGIAMPFEKYEQREAMHWKSYNDVAIYRERADLLTKFCCSLVGPDALMLDLGCGDGLFAHLIAQTGRTVIGVDPEEEAVVQARRMCEQQSYPRRAPEFVLGDGNALSASDATFDLVFMFDVIEHLPNPVATIRECARVLKPGGVLVASTPAWTFGRWSDPTYHIVEYTIEELDRQITAAARQTHPMEMVQKGHIGGAYNDLVYIARRIDGAVKPPSPVR